MTTISISLDDETIAIIDRETKRGKFRSRSAYFRDFFQKKNTHCVGKSTLEKLEDEFEEAFLNRDKSKDITPEEFLAEIER